MLLTKFDPMKDFKDLEKRMIDHIEANSKNGMLEIMISKSKMPDKETKKIEVK
ncbi:MAG: hypothetical protein PHE73_02895 [Sulfurovaceae bacterium]|nr:hypothetical protein [Sulfurovaceae bacterium]